MVSGNDVPFPHAMFPCKKKCRHWMLRTRRQSRSTHLPREHFADFFVTTCISKGSTRPATSFVVFRRRSAPCRNTAWRFQMQCAFHIWCHSGFVVRFRNALRCFNRMDGRNHIISLMIVPFFLLIAFSNVSAVTRLVICNCWRIWFVVLRNIAPNCHGVGKKINHD